MRRDVLKAKFPFILVTSMFVISLWMLLRGLVKYISLWLLQLGYSPITIPFIIGDPLNNPFLIELFFSFFILINMWLLSTKVKFYQEIKMRYVTFFTMIFGIVIQYLWNATIPIFRTLIPYIVNHQEMIYIEDYALYQALFENTDNLMLFILSLPAIFIFITIIWLIRFCNDHWTDLMKFFKEYEYKIAVPPFIEVFLSDDKKRKWAKKLKEAFDETDPDVIPLPDVAIGPNIKTGEMVIQRGKDRTLNNLIIGAIGTGKTSALVLPILNQDLHHMTNMINNFEKYYSREDYHTEDVKGRLLNGISVIEPSKDLCDKTYQLVLAHGIPPEAVYYVDPTNPNTPSLNLFKGPTDKVAEMFTMVISGIGESQEFFFEQSQRSHLKHHIYLLKEHDPEAEVGFEDLINMYNDPQLVAEMHQKLKARIAAMGDPSQIEDRDERNQLLILKGISEWFDMTYVPVEKGFGKNAQPDIIKEGRYRGQQRVEDKKSEHVVGLRNILNDIASNILLRRVLFGKSDFDFDKHLEYGGILLVNTAKGELANLSDVLGKFVLLSLQNAVFRRKPNDSPYHHILVDEFPDYLNEDFASFPAQSRKYKAIITVVAQTVSQLQRKYGPDFMTTLIATLRNKFIYGDTTQLDAEMFSSIFGEKIVFEESETEQTTPVLMDDPSSRKGLSYTKKQKEQLSASEIIYQDAFVAAVKLVENNKPIPAQQVRANFVPKEEFKKATVVVDPEKAKFWLKVRNEGLKGDTQMKKSESQSFQDTESVMEDEDLNIVLPQSHVTKPLKDVDYDTTSSLVIDQAMFAVSEQPTMEKSSVTHEIITKREEKYTESQEKNSKEQNVNEISIKEEHATETKKEESSSISEMMADWLMSSTDGKEQESNVSEKDDKEAKVEMKYVEPTKEEDTISFDEVIANTFNFLSSDEQQEEEKDIQRPSEEKDIKEKEQSKKEQSKNQKEHSENPFDESFIKPIGASSQNEDEENEDEELFFDYEQKTIDEEELKSYEKRKKEMQRRKLEKSRIKYELEKQQKRMQEEKRKQEEKNHVESPSINIDDLSDEDINQLINDSSETNAEDIENLHQEHNKWKQEQIEKKRKNRKKTQIGDFGLFHDILSVLNNEEDQQNK
jgi:TraM recognition site of TraD and TraG